MAGTDRSQSPVVGGPSIVLVEPQLGENIGAAARAMLNFGLGDLRLVSPRDGWPSEKAVAAASGADVVIESATVYADTTAALDDLQVVYAMTARRRDLRKDMVTPRYAASDIRNRLARGERCGILFGPERAGLHNDDISLADIIISVPSNPGFSSINLAQAVLIFGYEYFALGDDTPTFQHNDGDSEPATKAELAQLFGHLEDELRLSGFLFPPEKSPTMVRNIRAILQRARLTEQEVRTLRGVVSSLSHGRGQS
mgnify:CR=1 FL=1